MELEDKSLLPSADEQETALMELNSSAEMNLLSQCQSQVEGSVIIYDTESQENTKEDKSSEDPDNFITLHASIDPKSEVQEEAVGAENLDDSIKTSPTKTDEADNDTDDDETIATFVTSTGQQLALYAVEDSDEIFAVALYDESGEPPTNFHFLMKADVERLIGEGAVKTVKKPQVQPNKESKPAEKKEEIKFERLSDLKAKAEKEEAAAAQLKKVHELKTEIVEVPGPQPKVQTPKPEAIVQPPKPQPKVQPPKPQPKVQPPKPQPKVQTPKPQPKVQPPKPQPKVVPKAEHKTTVIIPNHNPINRNVYSPKVSTVTKTTKSISNVYQTTKPVTKFSQTTKAISNVYQNTRPISNVYQTAKPASNVYQTTKPVSNVYQTTKPAGSVHQTIKPISNVHQTTKLTSDVYQTSKSTSNVHQATKPTSNVYQPQMVEVKKEPKVAYVVSNVSSENQYVLDNFIEDLDSDAEIIEQSTVQYILCDGDPSDSEMTFDELQASLQSFKTNKSISNVNKTKTIASQKTEKKKENVVRYSSFLKSSPKVAPILSQKKESVTTVYRTYSKGPKKARMTNNLLHPIKKIKQEVVDPSYGDVSTFDDGHISSDDMSRNTSIQNASMTDISPGTTKVKRSRKQQLTMVNRTDSEIIIQPALTYSEEEEEPVVMRKRGRRKKKAAADPDYNPRKPIKKAKKANRSVEVIEIDVEESERSGAHEPMLEGNKGKGSSDKENDVISVVDSGEEEEEEAGTPKKAKKPMMQCTDCNRNFRKRKALEKHVQICPKSPAYIQKMEERKLLAAKSGKRFKCKSCDEMFDIAVSLARHVRVVHTLKKKGKQFKGWTREERSESSDTDDEIMRYSSPEREVGRKKRGRPPAKKTVVSESPSSNIELKLDSSTETLNQEPKRRGRPPGRKSALKERSATPDLEEKEASATESATEKQSPSSEPRKRGRPKKRSISEERWSLSPDPDDKPEDRAVPSSQPLKKRGRAVRRNLSKDDEQEAAEDKNESSTETEKASDSISSRKRGRVSKRSLSKDGKSVSSEADELDESSDEMPLEARKKARSIKASRSKEDRSASLETEKKNESWDKIPLEARKKSRTSKASVSKDDVSATPEIEENESSDEMPLEARKKARESKLGVLKDDSSSTLKADEKNESSDEMPLEARKKAITSKLNLSKDDRSVSPEVKSKPSKAVEDKSEEARSVTPDSENKEEKTLESKEQSTEVPAKEIEEETTQESKEKPIAELPKKRKLSKDESTKVDDPVPTKTEDKVENLVESSPEPRKRGRPAKSKSLKEDEAESAEAEEKAVELSSDTLVEPSRKRTRSIKESLSMEEESEIHKAEEKSEDSNQTPSETRRKLRISRARPSVEEEAEALVVEEKSEGSTETPMESRKRGRPSRVRISLEEESEVLEIEEKEKLNEVPELTTETPRRGKLNKDVSSTKDDESEIQDSKEKAPETSSESPELPRKRGRPGKEKTSKEEGKGEEELEIVNAEEKMEISSETPRRRGRPSKDQSSKSESIDDSVTEVEKKIIESPASDDKGKTKKKISSPNRTWKVKKLNCEDCGKWFSSATLLRTHRLQHRTKKSARLDADRCPLCRKAIPGDLFAKHMATVHKKKSPSSVSTRRRPDVRRVAKPARKPRSARTLRSSS